MGAHQRSKGTTGSRTRKRERTGAARRVHRVDARTGAGLGISLQHERLEPVTLSEPSFSEHLISPESAPVRRLAIGAEPRPGGGVDFRLWAPSCHEVVVEI